MKDAKEFHDFMMEHTTRWYSEHIKRRNDVWLLMQGTRRPVALTDISQLIWTTQSEFVLGCPLNYLTEPCVLFDTKQQT
jgi:hypothetical protein